MLRFVSQDHLNEHGLNALLNGKFLYAQMTNRNVAGIQSVVTADFDCSDRTAVHVAFHSAYEQDDGGMGGLEYSVDGGATWEAVVYRIDATHLVYDEAGELDAVATLGTPRDKIPRFIDSAGKPAGGSYGEFLNAEMNAQIAPAIVGTTADNANEAKRLEVFRLPLANGQSKVRFRFIHVGPGGGYWGIDNLGLYDLENGPSIETPKWFRPTTDPNAIAGLGLATILRQRIRPVVSAAIASEDFDSVPVAEPLKLESVHSIWRAATSPPGEVVYFRKTFGVQEKIMSARLLGMCDDEVEVFINGKRVMTGQNKSELFAASIGDALSSGTNVLAVRGRNRFGRTAGLVVELEITLESGKRQRVGTDGSWVTSGDVDDNWQDADYTDSEWNHAYVHTMEQGFWSSRITLANDAANDDARSNKPALLLCRHAAQMAPKNPWIQLALAVTSAREGELRSALQAARSSLGGRPFSREQIRVWASLYCRLGDKLATNDSPEATTTNADATTCYEMAHALYRLIEEQPNQQLVARLAGTELAAKNEMLLPRHAVWKYLDDGPEPDNAWRETEFDDSRWPAGPARLGYDDGAVTTVRFGPDPSDKRPTTYFRRTFEVEKPLVFGMLKLRMQYDDGVVLYLNGTEITRPGMPAGDIRFDTWASNTQGRDNEQKFFDIDVPATSLRNGTNIIAAEVHQSSATSSDLGFDLEIEGVRHLNVVSSDVPESIRINANNVIELPSAHRAVLWLDRTDRFVKAMDLANAAKALAKVQQLDPGNPCLSYYRALILSTEDNDEAAYTNYVQSAEAVMKLKSNNALISTPIVAAHLRHDIEPIVRPDAVAIADAAIQLADSGSQFDKAQIQWLLRWSESIDSESHEASFTRAAARLAIGHTDSALNAADSVLAVEESPTATAADIRRRRDWLRLREQCLEKLGRFADAELVRAELLTPPPRRASLSPNLIDLTQHFNASLYDGRWDNRDKNGTYENCLRMMPETFRPPNGVEFDLRGLVQLNSGTYDDVGRNYQDKDINQYADKSFPDSVAEIIISQKAKALHFLVSSIHGRANQNDEVARFVIHYDDNSQAVVPLLFGVDIDDWYDTDDTKLRERIAWEGDDPQHHVTLKSWQNPNPDKMISHVDFVSGKRFAAPFLVAITAE